MKVWVALDVDKSLDDSCTKTDGNWERERMWIQVRVRSVPQIGATIVLPTPRKWFHATGHAEGKVRRVEHIGPSCVVCYCEEDGTWWGDDTIRDAEAAGYSRSKPHRVRMAEESLLL